jgi:large subunit ribosomal protein L31e
MADKAEKELERIYTIPLREIKTSPRNHRTDRAVRAVKSYLSRHMKSEEIWLDRAVNEKLWERGMYKIPSKIRVRALKFDDGVVEVTLPETDVTTSLRAEMAEAREKREEEKAKKSESKEKKDEEKPAEEKKEAGAPGESKEPAKEEKRPAAAKPKPESTAEKPQREQPKAEKATPEKKDEPKAQKPAPKTGAESGTGTKDTRAPGTSSKGA